MTRCLASDAPMKTGGERRHDRSLMERLEDLLSASPDRALYLCEICAIIGVSERTLRVCCHEHWGIGPIRYLWLRRMHLARQALAHADPAKTTVTAVAADFGFWELGRFAVAYRKLFGESPSATLRRPCHNRPRSRERPVELLSGGYA